MANRLTGLKVNRISLVNRAAVRDPSDPTQPRRFLLMKAEDADNREDTPLMAAASDADTAIARAVHELAPHRAHPSVQKALGALGEEDFGEGAQAVSKAIRQMSSLAKAEDLPRATRERCDKASRELQLEVLRKSSPRAAEAYERSRPDFAAA